MKTFIYLILVVMAFLVGCAKRETAVEAGIRTQTLLVGNDSEPITLDPHQCVDAGQRVLYALFEGLTSFDEVTMQAVPAVAERWDISPDGLAYTFYLRADARWSNGDPVTARDFAFSFKRILTPELASSYSYMLWDIRNAKAYIAGKLSDFAQVGVEVVDDRTLKIKLERPTPHLPLMAAHTTWLPLHRATVERYGKVEDRAAPWTKPENLVSNGPFTLVEWKPNEQIVVKKNPLYRAAASCRLERIVFFPTENREVEERNFRAGQVHVTSSMPSSKVSVYRERNPAVFRNDPMLHTGCLSINTTRPPLDNPKVRRALSLAVDREAIARVVYAGARLPANSLTPPHCGRYSPKTVLQHDAEKARALLSEAGYAGGKGLPPIELIYIDNETARIAEMIQESWRSELGVQVRLAKQEWKVLWQYIQTKQYAIAVIGPTADYPDPMGILGMCVSDGLLNITCWRNERFDELVAKAAREADLDRRYALFEEAEKLLLDEASFIPLVYGSMVYLKHPAVKGWVPSPLVIRRYQNVWLER
jgi:oligopeptide transport system substrate-binding protein